MAKALTTKAVEAAQAGTSRKEIPDGLLTGLYLVVQPSGAKSWAVRYRYGGKPRKLTLGAYPTLELGDARIAAQDALRDVAKGNDPAWSKREAREEARAGRDLIETVFEDFLKRHRKRNGDPVRSLPEMERQFNRDVLPKWKGRRVQDITRRDVIELLDGIVDRGVGVTANRVFATVRKFFNWCLSRDIIAESPCAGITPPAAEVSRDRVLSDEEIKWFWKATGQLGYPFGPAFRLMLLTGQREGEVAGLLRSELDIDARLWSLPGSRTKNGRPNDVPLSDLAIETLEGLPKIASHRRLVFTTTGETPISGFSRAKANLDKEMTKIAAKEAEERGEDVPALASWRLHDLRRTVATGLQRLAIPPHVTEAVLNHKSGTIQGVAAVYSRHDYAPEKRSALEAWSRFLTDLIEGRADNVVRLHEAVEA